MPALRSPCTEHVRLFLVSTWKVDKLGSAASHDKMVAAVRGVAAAANKDRKLSETVQKGACTEAIAAAAAAANAPAAAAAIMAAAIVNAGAYNEGADTTEAEIMSAKQELASLPLSSSLLRLLVGTHTDWEKARALGEQTSSSQSSATGAGNSTVSSDTSGSSGSSSSTGSGRDGVSALKSRNPLDDMEGVNDDVSNPAPATTPETANTAASTAASSTATVATPAAAAAAASLTALKAATAAARGVLWNQLAAAPPEGLPSSPAEVRSCLCASYDGGATPPCPQAPLCLQMLCAYERFSSSLRPFILVSRSFNFFVFVPTNAPYVSLVRLHFLVFFCVS